MSSLPADLRQLPVSDRIELVEALWDSIADDQSSIDLTESQKAELDRRLDARQGRDAASSWTDVKRRILGQ